MPGISPTPPMMPKAMNQRLQDDIGDNRHGFSADGIDEVAAEGSENY